MNHITKLLVLASMVTALVIEAALMARGWPAVLPWTIAILVISCAVSLRFAEPVAAFVLLFTYIFPAVVFAFRGRFEFGFMTIWIAALLGVMLPGLRKGWALAPRWRVPLILWALTVALVWPLVALREIDFAPTTLDLVRSVTGPPGVPPQSAIVWSLNVALVLGLGILWFDWLSAIFDGAERRFRKVILGSLAVSWLATTSVAVYQLMVDMTFLNSGLFGYLLRASGLMFDANPLGVIAALGIPAVAAAALLSSWRWRNEVALAIAAFGWVALWASGSRTALAAGIVSTTFVLYYSGEYVVRWAGISRRVVVGAVVVASALILVPVLLQRLSDVGAWRRLSESIPELTTTAELWNRNGYGTVAARMIQDFPAFGIGVGSFHYLILDYSRIVLGGSLPGDNAQNWYRHQLAEFGIVGSLGWILWTLSFGWFVVATRLAGPNRWAAGAIRGGLVAIALISLVGMPTQNLAVTLTFWTMAFWYTQLAGEPAPALEQKRIPLRAWIVVWAIATTCVAGTARLARQDLRVPIRAAVFGSFPYSYGFFEPEMGPNGQFRWAGRKAVAVVDAPKPWMKLTISVNQLNITSQPVDVRVWCDGEEVVRTTLTNVEPVTKYVRVKDERRRVVLETWANRTIRPADFGFDDPRDLGLMVQWDFADAR